MKNFFIAFLIIVACAFMSTGSVQAQTFTFGAAGDFGNGANFTTLVNQAKNDNPAFMVALGDFAYSQVEQSWCNVWKTAGVNTALIAGNHDDGGGDGDIDKYTQFCPYALQSQLIGTYGKQYYFDYPTGSPIARFIFVSPGLSGTRFSGVTTSFTTSSAGYSFVSNAIDTARNSGIKWIIVGMHKNYISVMVKQNEVGQDLIPLLINKKVDLILQGHEHGYERSKQLRCARVNSYDASCIVDSDNNLVKGAGSIIHVIGTGGIGLRGIYPTSDSEAPYFAAIDNTTHGYGKFVVSPTSINFNFVRTAKGNFTDSFTISGSGTVPTSTPNPTGSTNLQLADVNSDRTVDIIDIGIVVDNYGRNPIPNPKADINRDSVVNILDIGIIIDYYGRRY